MDDSEDDTPPPVPRPEKNVVFLPDENIGVFPSEIFEGKLGPLPLLISVNVGYHPDDQDPFMHYYESQEIMFAYKEDAQKRVLLKDAYGRTLSLPLHSKLPFRLGADTSNVLSMAQIVSSRPLPVPHVMFAREDSLDIIVDKHAADHGFFGSFTVTAVYDEPFYWCLAVEANGRTKEKPIVLPRNLKSAGFSPVVGVSGVSDPADKVKAFIEKYTQVANQLQFDGDPFFQELAFVSRDPKPVDTIKPYIDEKTFIPIEVRPDPPPRDPTEPHPPPARPPPVPQRTVSGPEGRGKEDTCPYSRASDSDSEDHVYVELSNLDINLKTPASKPLQTLTMKAPAEDRQTLPRRPDKDEAPDKPPVPPPIGARSPTGEGPPLPSDRKKSDSDRQQSPRCSVDLMSPPSDASSRAIRRHLNNLSVEEVAQKLKQLGLEKYAKKFRKNRIDGVLLQKLREEDLKKEFGMSHMEFLLLDTYIHEGHVPQTSKSKTGGKTLFRP